MKRGWLIIGLGLLYAVLALLTPFPVWDEMGYLANARSHYSQSFFTEDFRFPLLEYLIAGWWLITGESVFAARFFIILCSLATTVLIYWWVQRRYPQLAFSIAAAFAMNTLVLQWSIVAYAELPAVLAITAAFVLLSEKPQWAIGAGILSGLSAFLRYPLLLFAIAAIVTFAWNRKWKILIVYLGGLCVSILPWFLFWKLRYQDIFWGWHRYSDIMALWTPEQAISVQVFNAILVFLFLLPFLILALFRAWRKTFPFQLLGLYVTVSLFYYLFIVGFKPSRYFLVFLPHALFLIADVLHRLQKPRFVLTVIMLTALCSAVLGLGAVVHRMYCDADHPIVAAVQFLATHTVPGDKVQSNVWPYFGYFNNLRAIPLKPGESIDLDTRYILWENSIGTTYPRERLSLQNLVAQFSGQCGQELLILTPE